MKKSTETDLSRKGAELLMALTGVTQATARLNRLLVEDEDVTEEDVVAVFRVLREEARGASGPN